MLGPEKIAAGGGGPSFTRENPKEKNDKKRTFHQTKCEVTLAECGVEEPETYVFRVNESKRVRGFGCWAQKKLLHVVGGPSFTPENPKKPKKALFAAQKTGRNFGQPWS